MRPTPRNENRRPFPWRRALATLLVTAVFLGLHIAAVEMAVFGKVASIVFFWLYYALLLGFGVAYVLYNRGFTRDSLTHQDLPEDWSEEKKDEFFRSRDERKMRSRWMVTVLFALAVTFIYEMVVLFFGDWFAGLFKGGKS